MSPYLPLVMSVAVLLIVVVSVVLVVSSCSSHAGDASGQAESQAQEGAGATGAGSQGSGTASNGTSTTAQGSASRQGSAGNVPDPAWKTAANVPELTKSGTDPTAIAASMEAERMAANEAQGYKGVESPWTASGLFTSGDKELDQMVKKFCDKYATQGKSASDNAFNTFCNITWSDYVEWEGNQYPHVYDWTVSYAKDFFKRGGNCFSMASAIQWCLRYYGYSDAHAEITYQLRQSGGWLDHGLNWVTNKETGEICLVDSELSTKGWMLPAGAYSVEILDPTSNWEPRSSAFNVNRG